MANDNRNIALGAPLSTGAAFAAPLGTALPTTEIAVKNVAFKALGYIGESGVVRKVGQSITNIKAWGGDIVRKPRGEHDVTYEFTCLETLNPEAMKLAYGDGNVDVTAATISAGQKAVARLRAGASARRAFIFEVVDSPAIIREVVPNGEVTGVGDITFVESGVISYPLTVSAYADLAGNKAYQYSDSGIFAVA